MEVTKLDARGLKCPQPTLKLTGLSLKMQDGDVVEVVADCDTFEKDVKEWCTRWKKPLLWIRDEGDGVQRCQIRF